MKIIVLNGSPKGDVSVTMQYVAYIRKKFPDHEYKIVNIGLDIRKIEKDEAVFHSIIDEVRSAELVLFAFPLYYLLVSSQYKRFIELLFERKTGDAFRGKYCASFSTSIHFMDHFAHRYIHAVCDDLGMQYCGSYSAEMRDLLNEIERRRLEQFVQLMFSTVQNNEPVQRDNAPLVWPELSYLPGAAPKKVETGGRKIVILSDSTDDSSNLAKMAARVRSAFAETVELINLHDMDIRGGCLGCLQCGYDNSCVYTDGFRDFFEQKLGPADIIIMAGTVHDRYLSSKWKQFFDRSFFHGHTPALAGKQIGFVIDGPLQQLPYLREALTAWADNQKCNILFVTDEVSESAELDTLLDTMANRLVKDSVAGYIPPPTFYAVGGHKIFRDAIYGNLRFPFLADYRYYKDKELFDFPRIDLRTRAFNAVMILLIKIPGFRKKVLADMRPHMIKPFEAVIRDA